MKNELATLMLVFILSILLLGGCAPAVIQLTDAQSVEDTYPPTATPLPPFTATLAPTPIPMTPVPYPTITPPPSTVEATSEPAVSISPTSGPKGTVVQVVASGFPPHTEVSVGVGPQNSEYSLAAQGTTDAHGVFIAQVPVQMGPGTNLVFAAAMPGQRGINAPDLFQVVGEIEPAISISPTSGPKGTVVQVVASGYPPHTEVSVGVGPLNSEFGLAAQGTTDAYGVFVAQVPVQMDPGTSLIFAAAVPGQPGVKAPDIFYVTGADATPMPTPTPYLDMWTTFANLTYAISLEYPADWKSIPGYGDPESGTGRIGGINGFFQISAMDSDSIDAAAAAEAEHKLQPYGSHPTVEIWQIQGQEARIITPADDQPAGMQHQAALIVRYPRPVNISGTPCRYFVLWADLPHIRTIAQTLYFLEVIE